MTPTAVSALLSRSLASRVSFQQAGDAIDHEVPRLLFPVIAARRAVHRLGNAAIVDDVVLDGRALGTQRALVDGMVGIALDVDDRGPDVAALVAESVNDDAASHRAIRAGGAGLGGAGDLERPHFGVSLREVKAKYRRGNAADGTDFQEISSRRFHTDLSLPERLRSDTVALTAHGHTSTHKSGQGFIAFLEACQAEWLKIGFRRQR